MMKSVKKPPPKKHESALIQKPTYSLDVDAAGDGGGHATGVDLSRRADGRWPMAQISSRGGGGVAAGRAQ